MSFQWFKTQLLAKGLVEKLEVANKSMVKVGLAAGCGRVDSASGQGRVLPAAPGFDLPAAVQHG